MIVESYVPGYANFTRDSKDVPNAEFMAVLTKDDAGLYAVYVGVVPSAKRGLAQADRDMLQQVNSDRVARSGSKLRYSEIGPYFRGIKEEDYRA